MRGKKLGASRQTAKKVSLKSYDCEKKLDIKSRPQLRTDSQWLKTLLASIEMQIEIEFRKLETLERSSFKVEDIKI